MPEAIGMFLTGLFGASVSAATEVAIGMAVIMTGASMAFNAVMKAVVGKPKMPTISSDLPDRTITCRQAISPWTIAYGESGIGGIITYLTTTGSENEFLHLVVVHGSGQCNDVPKMYFDGVEVPVDANGDATGNFAGLVHWEKRLGSTDPAVQTPYAGLVTATSGSASAWTNNDLGLGHCHSWVRLKWDETKFPNGLPAITWKIQGRKVFDPRTGTKIYSNNFALCVRDYLMDPDVGMAATAAEMDDVANIAAANVCDEDVALLAGGTEKRYTLNGSFEADRAPSETLPALLTAGWGQAIYSAGKWGIYPAAWRAASLTLTDDDFRAPIQYAARIPRRELFNGVRGVYLSEANKWQPDDFPPYYHGSDRGYATDDYLTEDGERLWTDLQLTFTTSAARAQRIAKIALEEARRQGTLTAPCKLKAFQLVPSDVVAVTRPQFSWTAKTFQVREWKWTPEQDSRGYPFVGVDLVLRENDANCYTWSTTEELGVHSPGGVVIANPSVVAPPTGLTLASGDATALIRVDGVRISRIKATWTAPADTYVKHGGKILVQYKLHADSTWTDAGTCDGTATEAYIAGVNDNSQYDVQVIAVNSYGARSAPVVAGPHTVQPIAFPHGSYRPKTNPLTASDGGSYPIVSIAAFVMAIAGVGDKNINAGTVNATSGDYGKTAFVYYDDTAFTGGAVTFNVTFTREVALGGTCRFFVGSIQLPAAAAPSTIGNNDGGAGAQYTRSMRLLPSTVSASGWNNAGFAIDEDPSNYADATTSGADLSLLASGFSAFSGWFTSLVLRVIHQFTSANGGWVEYSKDGGSNWTQLRKVTAADTSPVTSEISLPAVQKSDQVQVRVTLPEGASAQSAKNAGTAADGGGALAWANPSNAQGATNSTYATATVSSGGDSTSNLLKLTNFGFTVPSGAGIRGIAVSINRKGTYATRSEPGVDDVQYVRDQTVQIIKGGTVQTAVNRAAYGYWPSTAANASYGGSADLWGQTWAYSDINNSGFGIAIAAHLYSGPDSGADTVASIDSVTITVYYSTGGGVAGAGRVYSITQEVSL